MYIACIIKRAHLYHKQALKLRALQSIVAPEIYVSLLLCRQAMYWSLCLWPAASLPRSQGSTH